VVKRVWLVHGLVALVGLLGAGSASEDIRGHAQRLLDHLRTGSWEAVSDRPYHEAFVKRQYAANPEKWVISFVAATGNSWSLDERSRLETVRQLGHWALDDPEAFSFRRPEIFVAYRFFLAEALAETAARIPEKERSALERLANALRQVRAGQMSKKERALFEAVKEALDQSPLFRELSDAVQVYKHLEMTISSENFGKFPVFSNPPYDEPLAWRDGANGNNLGSEGRCLGKAHAYDAHTGAVEVDFTSHPRLLKVELVRPWLADYLLDKLAAQPGPNTRKYFGERGELGLIPTDFWVVMPEQVRFQGVSRTDEEALRSWTQDNVCCRLVCGAAEVRLDNHETLLGEDKRFVSLRADVPPILFAVASRRRVVP
jgi:hypothetical protein